MKLNRPPDPMTFGVAEKSHPGRAAPRSPRVASLMRLERLHPRSPLSHPARGRPARPPGQRLTFEAPLCHTPAVQLGGGNVPR